MNFAAHELLETQEALRTKSAEIEQHGAFANQCSDQHLKNILMSHQQQMISAYQQGVNLMQGKGVQLTHEYPNFRGQNTQVGMQQQSNMSSSVPNPNPQTLSDKTMATLALNAHKAGAMMGMQWANECVDTQLRSYHVNGANLCQEMAYDMWVWMNQNGYYQPPSFGVQKESQMTSSFQPMHTQTTMTNMGNQMQ
ncbi:spore coat protein [Aquibacillus rhizosphaerae]|uniref:Spore coat protein n=1 Tax=Aquibacillus rhizosphaerae TaxID=3051431 RepID=A0ABT7L3H1_9BACI|nr:spore coat protein [Aquibacillus sp. LR5S19]MDL4839752.1 spore coat protein [Aquibacillus sp. LR5S19]